MPQHLPEEMLTLEQCATLLQIHPKTLRRYLAQHAIEFCVLNPHSKRHQIRIARSALEAFIRKNTQCLPSP